MKRNKRPMKTKQKKENQNQKSKRAKFMKRTPPTSANDATGAVLEPLFILFFFLVVSLRLFNQLDEIKLKLTNPNQININHPTNQTTDECSWRFPLAIPEPS